MRRLFASLRCDLRLQYRNGFYYAAAFVVGVWVLMVQRLPALDWGVLLPVVILNNLLISTFYFLGGLVLLEKGEGTLEAQVVTPLRTGEYLASKVITLTLLSLVENLILVGALVGREFRVLPLTAGTLLAGAIFCLLGFLAVARYDSINEYLLPSMLYTTVLLLPLFPYFGIGESPLVYLHPVQAPLVLLQGAFRPVPALEMVYGVLYAALWIGVLYLASRRAFLRFIITRTVAAR